VGVPALSYDVEEVVPVSTIPHEFLPNAPGSEIWMHYLCFRSLPIFHGLEYSVRGQERCRY
jgi:hypothetical protein